MASISEQNQQLQNGYSSIQPQNQQIQVNQIQTIPKQKQILRHKNLILFGEEANQIYIQCLQQLKDSYSLNEKISYKIFQLFQKLFVKKIENLPNIIQHPTAKQIKFYHTKMLKRFGTTDKIIQQLSKQDVYKDIKQGIFKKINKKRKTLDRNVIIKKELMQKGQDGQKTLPGTVKINIRQNLLKILLLKHVRQCLIKGQYTQNGDQKIYPNMNLPVICHIPIKKRPPNPNKKKIQKQMQKLNLSQNDD